MFKEILKICENSEHLDVLRFGRQQPAIQIVVKVKKFRKKFLIFSCRNVQSSGEMPFFDIVGAETSGDFHCFPGLL
jgi:hypothetical protein